MAATDRSPDQVQNLLTVEPYRQRTIGGMQDDPVDHVVKLIERQRSLPADLVLRFIFAPRGDRKCAVTHTTKRDCGRTAEGRTDVQLAMHSAPRQA